MEENMILEEVQAAEEEKELSGVYECVLKHPVYDTKMINGKSEKVTYKTLKFDFASLTGRDMVEIDRELQSEGESVFMRAVHPVFLLKVCARAAKVSEDVIASVTAREYDKITSQARLFFLKQE